MEEQNIESSEAIETSTVPEEQGQPNETISNETTAAVSGEQTAKNEEITDPRFAGKSPSEIIKAYHETERLMGRQAQELGEYRRRFQMSQENKPVMSKQEKTLEDIFLEDFDKNPANALLNYQKGKEVQQFLAREEFEAQNLVNSAKSGKLPGWEDFNELEPLMIDLAIEHQHLLNPALVNSPKAIQALLLMARGASLSAKEKKLEETAINKAAEKVRAKERAIVENSSPTTKDSEEVSWDMSIEEIRKRTPKRAYVE